MDDPAKPFPDRRPQQHDGDVLAPRIERELPPTPQPAPNRSAASMPPHQFEPPTSSLGLLFRHRLERIHKCRVPLAVDVNPRPTLRVLGGYYRSRRLVRVYSHDRALGRRPLEELFDTFLHEVAHHLEYTEPSSFGARACRRVHGLMHSRLFWRILGELRRRWANLCAQHPG